ncbi:MAG TPA: cobyric acid synthase [Desulfitobacteriaceae bacterium]|nr:cobyric acid synthase [Desulfitobacteriaceae bacterium]
MSPKRSLKGNSALMIQGTSSNVGKSVLAAAFCRIFYQEGYLTCPFKAQNMALNSFVTIDGGEMGRAQVVQAQAAGREPDVLMNPILLKPTGQASSQVIILGKPQGTLSALRYHGEYQRQTWPVVQQCLRQLKEENDVLIIEGAGSPAEVNLKQNDIVNMRVALEIKAPVLLVADIDRGGALASVVGTLELLEPEERAIVKGVILNKFRGDIKLLQPALDFLAQKTGIPVLGVVPYYTDFDIPEEDSVALDKEKPASSRTTSSQKLDIVVIRLPFISNFTDFDALKDESDVQLRYVNKAGDLGNPDLVIIPGSKNTLADLGFLHESGLAEQIKQRWRNSGPIIGICGGYQMMGRLVRDPHHTESDLEVIPGLDILPMETEFYPEKYTVQSKGIILTDCLFLKQCQGQPVVGYEIHMGRSFIDEGLTPLFELTDNDASYTDGLQAGSALGTYLHGIFDNDDLRQSLLEWLWELKGSKRPIDSTVSQAALREMAFNQLADLVRHSLDMAAVRSIMGL